MALPDGVTAGLGVVNLVNCITISFGFSSYNDYCYHIYVTGKSTDNPPVIGDHTIKVIGRYVDSDLPDYSVIAAESHDHTEVLADSWYWRVSFWYSYFYYYLYDGTITAPNWIESPDYGNTATSYGTSQYSTGYAPIPTTRRLEVGTGKTYSTVSDAYAAANHGDNIVIFPGTYSAPNIVVEKCVRFYGSTEDPTDVVLTNTETLFTVYPYRMTNVPENERGPGFFHLTLQMTSPPSYWYSPLVYARTNADYDDPNPWIPDTIIPANALMFSCNT